MHLLTLGAAILVGTTAGVLLSLYQSAIVIPAGIAVLCHSPGLVSCIDALIPSRRRGAEPAQRLLADAWLAGRES